MIVRMIRRLLCRLLGAPTCRACQVHDMPCIQRCNMTEAERAERYIEHGPWW